jgi:hypothetical protein
VTATVENMRLSHSQLTGWASCGERHRLERVIGVTQRPGWALIGGSALHEMTENYDFARLGVDREQPSFEAILERRVAEAEDKSGIDREAFTVSGRQSKEWPKKENVDWWLSQGPLMFNRWVTFTQNVPWDIWFTPSGSPAIEVAYDLPLNNGVVVRGYVDRVMVDGEGNLIIMDLKTGASKQPTPRQLGTYKVGMEDKFPGIEFRYGTFWDARSGVSTAIRSLNSYTRARIEWQYGKVREAKELGIYIANPSMMCGSCQVRDFCYEYTPDADATVQPPWVSDEEWSGA